MRLPVPARSFDAVVLAAAGLWNSSSCRGLRLLAEGGCRQVPENTGGARQFRVHEGPRARCSRRGEV